MQPPVAATSNYLWGKHYTWIQLVSCALFVNGVLHLCLTKHTHTRAEHSEASLSVQLPLTLVKHFKHNHWPQTPESWALTVTCHCLCMRVLSGLLKVRRLPPHHASESWWTAAPQISVNPSWCYYVIVCLLRWKKLTVCVCGGGPSVALPSASNAR